MRSILLASLAGLWGLLSACPVLAAAPGKPNVVFYYMDTLRADHVHCYGYPRETSPSLDALAARGTRFDVAIAQATWSLPSYATMFTSLYPAVHGLIRTTKALAEGTPTLASILASYGYQTAAFVAGGHLLPNFGLYRGFQTYQSTQLLGSSYYTVPPAVRWLDRRKTDAPFFMVVHGYDVHCPYSPPLGFGELFEPDYQGPVHQPGFLRPEVLENIYDLAYDPCLLSRFQAGYFQQFGLHHRRRLLLPPFMNDPGERLTPSPLRPEVDLPRDGCTSMGIWMGPGGLPYKLPEWRQPLSPRDVDHIRAHYDGSLRYGDMWFGLFMEALKARGLAENTIVLVAGDHGEELGERGRFGHGGSLYDTHSRVPLIVSGPGVAKGRVVTDVVGLIDLAPTFLEVCRIPASHQFQGQSLAAYLDPARQPPVDRERGAFIFELNEVALRTADWLLVSFEERDTGELAKHELFDLRTDPAQRIDLSKQRPDVVSRLFARLQDWAERTTASSRANESSLDSSKRSFFRLFGYW